MIILFLQIAVCLLLAHQNQNEAEEKILKHDDGEDIPIKVKASVSHQYIANNAPIKIGVLFDITTSNIKLSDDADNTNLREPYELAIVLDRSGSMAGQKIKQAKMAIVSIVDNMIEGDIIHIIQYDNTVQTLIYNGGKSSQREILMTINEIHVGGATNLFGGLERGYNLLKQSKKKRVDNKISHSRIFLFSDGLLNAGITDNDRILNEISKWKNELDLTISTFGIGYDFDRKLMTSIAEQGKGDFFFIDSADAMSKVVEIARKDAANIIGTEAMLTVKTMNDTSIDIKLNDLFQRAVFDTNKYKGYNQIGINDLRVGDSKYAVIELLIEPKDVGINEKKMIDILEWTLTFDGKSGIFTDKKQSISGKVDIQITTENDEILKKDENINDDVSVFWKLNEMRSLDKEILDDIEDGHYNEAVKKRRKRRRRMASFHADSHYASFKKRAGESTKGQTAMNIERRMFNIKVENPMNKIQQMIDDGDDVDMTDEEKEILLLDYQNDYVLNVDSSADHMEL